MTIPRNIQKRARRGAYAVEFAVVAMVFFLVLFGLLEYSRFVFYQQLLFNAAREGARFAVVNTVEANVVTDTQSFVKKQLAGVDAQVTNYNCQVYMSDSSGKNIGPAQNAQFGQYVAVQITCDYNPLLPSFLFLNKTIPLTSRSLMYSEAN